MFNFNKDFYPTTPSLIAKMISKISWSNVKDILEPSAGKADIIDYINENHSRYQTYNIKAIEIDVNLQHILRGIGIEVIDSDFLNYNGLEQFDLIIANFPFSDGDKHLHKAIDILFSGQIVCLLNAETIKNPYSNSRKDLVRKLKMLDATIEYIPNAFVNQEGAERTTGVEVALIYINKVQDVETDLFNNLDETNDMEVEDIKDNNTIATKNDIGNIVKRYNEDKEKVTNQIMDFYKNYNQVSKYLTLSIAGLSDVEIKNDRYSSGKTLTELMKTRLNQFAKRLKKDYWIEAMQLDEIKSRLTSQKRKELINELNSFCSMDFTEHNIKIFIQNIIEKYPVMITEAIEYVFDKFTEYALRDVRNGNNEFKANIHLYSGWKTNDAFKVNKKVILPFYRGYSDVDSAQEDMLDDMDLVFNYFDNNNIQNEEYMITSRNSYSYDKGSRTQQTGAIVKNSIRDNITKNIKTRYFNITLYKKGTMHFVFNDLEMLRRFNIYIAKKRGWLPSDYGYTKEQTTTDFETTKEYIQIGTELAIDTKNIMLLN